MCDQQYKLSRRCPGGRGAGPPDGGSRWTIDTSVGQWLFLSLIHILKATTEEGLGFTGTGEGISAQAICCLLPIMDLVADDRTSFGGCPGCGGCRVKIEK